jgi:exodeoxyribonuclease X
LQFVDTSERAVIVKGLTSEQPRYFLQHALCFQVHGAAQPHRPRRHGRADIGMGDAMTPWTEHRYAVIDVEGNGQHPPDLVELAVVSIAAGETGEPGTWLCKPDEPITPMAGRIHGITNEMVAGSPTFAEVAAEVRAHLSGAILVAHNASVDLGVLQRKLPDFEPADVLDTLKLSRRLLPGQASHRLGALASQLHLAGGLPSRLQPHRATYDVLITARLFVHLATRADGTPMTFEELSDKPGGDHVVLF